MSVSSKLKRAWFALRDWRDRRSVCSERVGAARITWNPRHLIYVRAYYRYCVGLFRSELLRSGAILHLKFGDYADPPDTAGRVRRIDFQIEHTIVKPGGGDSAGAPASRTPLPHAEGHYLARLVDRERLGGCDLVIEYSAANLAHLGNAGGFENYLSRSVVLSPLLFEANFAPRRRQMKVITLFSDATTGRRGRFLDNARNAGITIHNVKRCFDAHRLRRLFLGCRILVNLRQSDHHETLEELRVLPALLCGVVVISEDVPLKEHIPYARFLIWSSFADLPATIARVEADYSVWQARIFEDPELKRILDDMRRANHAAVAEAVLRLAAAGART